MAVHGADGSNAKDLQALLRRFLRYVISFLQLDGPGLRPVNRAFCSSAEHWVLVLVLLWAVLYLPLLDARPLRFEEGRRAAQAIAILFGGNWWQLEIAGQPYSAKPPLLPWMMTLVAMVRGAVDEIAVRLPAVLMVVVGALAAAVAARMVARDDQRNMAGLLAGLAFLSSPFILLKGRIGETDTATVMFGGLALLIWMAARRRGPIGLRVWLLIGCALAGAGFAKGPIPVLFPLAPMVIDLVLTRRRDDAIGLIAALIIAFSPIMIWLALNVERTSAPYLAAEMRIYHVGFDLREVMLNALQLGRIPHVIGWLMPWILPVAIWLWRRRNTSDDRSLNVRALALAVVTVAVPLLLWPAARERYVMPIAWPMSVLAGLAMADFWQQYRMSRVVAITGLAFALIFQAGTFFLIEGRTQSQIERRALTDALKLATENATSRPLLAFPGTHPNFNIYAYVPRPMLHIRPEAINCPPAADILVAEGDSVGLTRQSSIWVERVFLDDGHIGVFTRTQAVPEQEICEAIGQPLITPEFKTKN